jgi:hypothetical protein
MKYYPGICLAFSLLFLTACFEPLTRIDFKVEARKYTDGKFKKLLATQNSSGAKAKAAYNQRDLYSDTSLKAGWPLMLFCTIDYQDAFFAGLKNFERVPCDLKFEVSGPDGKILPGGEKTTSSGKLRRERGKDEPLVKIFQFSDGGPKGIYKVKMSIVPTGNYKPEKPVPAIIREFKIKE